MTPKRLGVLIISILAVWSVVGPVGLSLVDDGAWDPGVAVATAGDPDQYTNGPSNGPGSSQDSTKTTSPAPPGGPATQKPGSLGTLLTVMSIVLWGSLAAS